MVIVTAIIVGITANCFIAGMPVILNEMVVKWAYSEQKIGFVASAYMGGMTVASVLCTFVITTLNRRWILAAGTVLAVISHLLIAMVQPDTMAPLVLIWIFAGFSQGINWSLVLACLSGTSNPTRNFAVLYLFSVAFIGLELIALPYLSATWNVEAIFYAFALVTLVCFVFIRFFPARYIETPEELEHKAKNPVVLPCFLSLGAICFFAANVNTFWAYAERIGLASGLSDGTVLTCLSLGNLASLTSCLFATWLGGRFGQARPLMITLVAEILIMAGLGISLTPMAYILGSTLFFMFWNVTDIFQLGSLSGFDHTGRYAVLVPAFQGIGFTLGPALAALLVGEDGTGFGPVLLMCAVSVLVSLGFYIVIHRKWGEYAI